MLWIEQTLTKTPTDRVKTQERKERKERERERERERIQTNCTAARQVTLSLTGNASPQLFMSSL
jgi:hypothetical protein